VFDVTSFQLFETHDARGGCIDGELMAFCLWALCIQSRFFMSVMQCIHKELVGFGGLLYKVSLF